MNKVIEKLKEIEIGEVGIHIYSTKEQKYRSSFNGDLIVPLASAAKVAIGFCMTKWVEEGLIKWDDLVEVSFNPEEDSKELYPHLQSRTSLPLREAVEVMIACHDSIVAKCIVNHCGGWEKVNRSIQSYYPTINVTENPRDIENKAQLDQLSDLMIHIYQGYGTDPLLWAPTINGLVRQKADVRHIPPYHLNHMTGGLSNVVVDIGMMGDFTETPYIYALGAIHLPDRYSNQNADSKIIEVMNVMYAEWIQQ